MKREKKQSIETSTTSNIRTISCNVFCPFHWQCKSNCISGSDDSKTFSGNLPRYKRDTHIIRLHITYIFMYVCVCIAKRSHALVFS